MDTKKDFFYQGIITILLIAVVFAFYKLYQPRKVETYKEVLLNVEKSIDIKNIKRKYEVIELKGIHNLKLKKMPKLEQKLVKLNESMQETLKLVEEYNFENPENQIDLDIDAERPFFSKIDTIAQKKQIDDYIDSYASEDYNTQKDTPKSTDTSTVSRSENKSNNLMANQGTISTATLGSSASGSGGGIFINGSEVSIDSESNTEPITTAYNSIDTDIVKYNTSIVELQGFMSQISSNLE